MVPGFFVEFPVFEIQFFVIICNFADNFAGISGGNGPVGNVFCNHTSGSNDYVITDMYARTNNSISTNPDIISNNYFDSIFICGITSVRMYRVSGCVYSHIRSHLTVNANFYFCHIENRTVVVGKEIFAHLNVISIVTVEGRVDKCSFRFSQTLSSEM